MNRQQFGKYLSIGSLVLAIGFGATGVYLVARNIPSPKGLEGAAESTDTATNKDGPDSEAFAMLYERVANLEKLTAPNKTESGRREPLDEAGTEQRACRFLYTSEQNWAVERGQSHLMPIPVKAGSPNSDLVNAMDRVGIDPQLDYGQRLLELKGILCSPGQDRCAKLSKKCNQDKKVKDAFKAMCVGVLSNLKFLDGAGTNSLCDKGNLALPSTFCWLDTDLGNKDYQVDKGVCALTF